MAGTGLKKAIKPSKVVKPSATRRRSTVTTKNHRFQSFSERISKLKIDPIRRRRHVDDQKELSEEASTYFGRALDEWRDLNMSRTFTSFSKDATPLCDNLATVLHNEERIMDMLVEYITRADALSLEPLLSLLSHFARDLDIRFETHFQRAVATVTSVAASHPDPAVVEWSFNSLAWLFKYLSRVLTPDLRPLYDLMSPYMGKAHQKPFIIRFAAESLSFLLRKAAAVYDRDPEPLDIILTHMLEDCCASAKDAKSTLHRQGVMTLLTESIKGVHNGIHSSGQAIVGCLLNQLEESTAKQSATQLEVLTGLVTSLIHHTTPETFPPILHVVTQHAEAMSKFDRQDLFQPYSQLILTMAAVRKGARVTNWSSLVSIMRKMVNLAGKSASLDSYALHSILSALAVVYQSAPIEAILPALEVLKEVRRDAWAAFFLHFCDLFARLGRQRFQTFLLPELQKFVLEHWEQHGDEMLFFLPKLPVAACQISCPTAFQEVLLRRVQSLAVGTLEDVDMAQLQSTELLLAARPFLKFEDATNKDIQARLLDIVELALRENHDLGASFRDFAMGSCFARLLDHASDQPRLRSLWQRLCIASSNVLNMDQFWSNVIRYLESCPFEATVLDGPHMEVLEQSLLQCLTLPSHQIREAALAILQRLYQLKGHDVPDLLSIAILVESTPVSLDTTRVISMNTRKLGQGYLKPELDPLMQQAIPRYCFGLLHLQLSQAWDDASVALAEMSKTHVAEEVITALSQTWLEGDATAPLAHLEERPTILDVETAGFRVFSDFECSNFAKIAAVCQQVFDTPNHGYPPVEIRAETPLLSSTARQQALRVLRNIPTLAEKKSRMLVPVLLSWASPASGGSDGETWAQGWSRKDQKALLAVFALFTNPKVLYRTSDVYEALLHLCANGDAEIQQSALKAVFTWKDPTIKQFGEHLTNLLEEARFREEVTVFLQGSEEGDEAIRAAQHPALMPVLLRLLYGRAVAGGKDGQRARRRTIFVALSRFGEETLGMFIDIALNSAGIPVAKTGEDIDQAIERLTSRARQQFGLLNMLDDLLETLGAELQPAAQKLLDAVTVCTVSATRKLDNDDTGISSDGSLLRSIRQVGMQCLAKLYSAMPDADFSTRTATIAAKLVTPRLDKFDVENTQSVSGTLRLLSAWAASTSTAVFLAEELDHVLISLASLLRQDTAKEEVRLFVLSDILDHLLEDGQSLAPEHVSAFVRSIGEVVNHQGSKDVLDACVASFKQLAGRIQDESEAEGIIQVCASLLTKPTKIVSPSSKTGLLETLSTLLDRFGAPDNSPAYIGLCGLFSRMRDEASRSILSEVFAKLCSSDDNLAHIARICEDLNAVGSRLDEPDLERRERGFVQIFEEYESFSFQQWQPILHNCLFYIRDSEDMVNRSNAARALQRFVQAASKKPEELELLATTVVLPSIERGMAEPSELVRAEYVRLLGHVVQSMPHLAAIADLQCLTVEGDDEASFFTNVLHIQQHRRLRALRRLADEAEQFSSLTVTKFLVPLLEPFVFNPVEGDSGWTLADQTIVTLGALAKSLKWSSFRAAFRRYTGLLKSQPDNEKATLRLLGVFVTTLHTMSTMSESADAALTKEARSEVITRDFLPPLISYLHLKDESTIDRRMPVAVTIVKLLQLLPEQEMALRLAPVLTDVCHVLRSRSVEARDQTRKALAEIVQLIGPSYFGFILKELRGALQRGYQLHVLSFTVHSLLVHSSSQYQPGDLDHCLRELMFVVTDDIFGVTGQEKEAEEYKTGMKEIKSSKSFDTMELLARIIPVPRLGQLIHPIRALLSEQADSKSAGKIDNLMDRLRKGLDQNPASESKEMLMFCHEIVRNVYAEQEATAAPKTVVDEKYNRYLIRPEPSNKMKTKTTTTKQTFKLISFALNLLRKVLRRHEDLMTPANLAGFLPIAGDALVQGQEEIQLSALRLLSTIMRVPLPELESNAPVYVKEGVRLLKSATSMTAESAKAALELVTAVLREKRSVAVREKDIGDILKAIKTDIDEPDRQGIIYKFIRAVLGRKIVITEVYEIMDEIAKAVVTNPDRHVREGARSAYIQFIMEYPQGKDRWNKQAGFFVENLKYEHSAGRQSTMELLHQLLSKVSDDIFEQLSFTVFVALVPVQASDGDMDCRKMAGVLISKIFERVDDEQHNTFLSLMEKWLQVHSSPAIQVASLQCWQVLLRTKLPSVKRMQHLRESVDGLLETVEKGQSEATDEVAKNALLTFAVLLETAPAIALAKESASIWVKLQSSLKYGQPDDRTIAAQLLETYFSDVASNSSKTPAGLSALPLRGSHGLELQAEDMRELCFASLRALLTPSSNTNEALLAQTTRNLAFLGRCFAANNIPWKIQTSAASDDSEDDAEANDDEPPTHDPSALAYLLNRLAFITRQDQSPPASRLAALTTQTLLLPHLSTIPSLPTLIRPAYSLTETGLQQQSGDATTKLAEKATELLEMVQKKVGEEVYLSALGKVRKEAKERREERRVKRRIEAVSAPERWAKDKRRRHEARKVVVKGRAEEARGKRRGW